MDADTKRDAKNALAISAALAALVTGGVYVSDLLINPAPPRAVTLVWTVNETAPGVVTEVWSSTNLTTWTLRTNVVGTNRVTLPADQPQEFFKVRNRLGSQVSDWSRKN